MMKKILVALIIGILSVIQLTADDCIYSGCCTDCFGFDSVLSFDVGGGYRQDNIQWDSFPPTVPALAVKEKWKNLQMGIVETNAQFLACEHFLVKADFDFGWFNNHNGKQTITGINLDSDYESEDLHARTKGRMYDVSGALGYQFNWCCFRYSFTPLVGYSYHYQKLKNSEYQNELYPEYGDFLAKNNYIYRWRGPTLGCTIAMQICCDWQVYFTYNYHWLRFRGKVHENFIANVDELKMKSNNCSGNEFVLGTTYQFSECWFLGIKVDYKCFDGNNGNITIEDKKIDPDNWIKYPLRKLKWDSLFVTLDVGLLF